MAKKETTPTRITAKSLILGAIVAGKTDEQVIALVQKKMPDSAVDAKHCTKYRREAFTAGSIGPEYAAVHSADHRAWAEKNAKDALKGPHKAHHKAQAVKAKAAKKAA